MKKKIIIFILMAILAGTIMSCGTEKANTNVENGASSVYSKEELDSAIEIIKKQFASFEGCELHSLSYMPDEECNNPDHPEHRRPCRHRDD